jgi:hypothetical protein
MADTIQVQRWSRPWEPAGDARLVRELDYWDMPLAGVIEQHGVQHLFACLAGHLSSTHLWLYRSLTNAELAQIERTKEPEELRGVVDELLAPGGSMVLAIADDDAGILGATTIDSLEDAELRAAIRRISEDLNVYLEEKRAEAEGSQSLLTERR